MKRNKFSCLKQSSISFKFNWNWLKWIVNCDLFIIWPQKTSPSQRVYVINCPQSSNLQMYIMWNNGDMAIEVLEEQCHPISFHSMLRCWLKSQSFFAIVVDSRRHKYPWKSNEMPILSLYCRSRLNTHNHTSIVVSCFASSFYVLDISLIAYLLPWYHIVRPPVE